MPDRRSTERRCALGLAAAASTLATGSIATPAIAAERYDLVLDGAPAELKDRLLQLSDLAQEKRKFATIAAVQRAGVDDAAKIETALKASGYYRARVRLELSASEAGEKVQAILRADPGSIFEITEHLIVYLDDGPGDRPRVPANLGVTPAAGAAGEDLAQSQRAMLQALWNAGYPEARAVGRRVELIAGAAAARAIYEIESGPRADFGPIEASGLDRTRTAYLEKLKTWEEGEAFERDKLIAYQDRLVQTGIFATIDVAPGPLGDDGRSPVMIEAEERARRTFGVGASFSTVEGIGARLFLEYRNVFGAGETARFDVAASEITQEATVTFTKPFPEMPGSAYANAGYRNQTTEAFDAQTASIGAGVAKEWLDGRLETRAGISIETSQIDTETTSERNYFASLPLLVVWDTETDPLALAAGERASVSFIPYAGSDVFTQAEFAARSRTNFGADDRMTLAGRVRVASVFGAPLDEIPINRRVFSGGGSSVRGYDFQAVGPIDGDGAPIGGRSAIEAAVEGRLRVAQSIQAAVFVDAGSVSFNSAPDVAGDWLVGAGVGARYLSAIGPIRVDFALPLERRSSDRAWQLYISLGQPF